MQPKTKQLKPNESKIIGSFYTHPIHTRLTTWLLQQWGFGLSTPRLKANNGRTKSSSLPSKAFEVIGKSQSVNQAKNPAMPYSHRMQPPMLVLSRRYWKGGNHNGHRYQFSMIEGVMCTIWKTAKARVRLAPVNAVTNHNIFSNLQNVNPHSVITKRIWS